MSQNIRSIYDNLELHCDKYSRGKLLTAIAAILFSMYVCLFQGVSSLSDFDWTECNAANTLREDFSDLLSVYGDRFVEALDQMPHQEGFLIFSLESTRMVRQTAL